MTIKNTAAGRPSAAAEQQDHAEQNRNVHTGHGDGMVNARDGQIVLILVAEPCFIAQQQRLYKARRVRRECGLDRRAEAFGKQSRGKPD